MNDFAPVIRELDALEKMHGEIAAITARSDDRRRYDLVQKRRELSAQIGRLGEVAEPVFTGTSHETAQLYRAKFSNMRSVMAMHQANWPAVLLGEREEEFRASTKRMREANREFIAWMRDALKRL